MPSGGKLGSPELCFILTKEVGVGVTPLGEHWLEWGVTEDVWDATEEGDDFLQMTGLHQEDEDQQKRLKDGIQPINVTLPYLPYSDVIIVTL